MPSPRLSMRGRLCRLPAAFCNRSSRVLFPKIEVNSVWTILATSQTFDTSFIASMQIWIRSWVAMTIDGLYDLSW